MKQLNIIPFTTRILSLIPFFLCVSDCKASIPGATPEEMVFNGDNALALIHEQMAFGDRTPGSEAHRLVGDWIIQELEDNGWEAQEQLFSYREFQGKNIIGMAGPPQGEWIILGAHYDTRPISDRDEKNPWTPVPGANDGGSGVAVLLELARVLNTENLTKSIWLVFFDLEDSGGIDGMDWIVGSTYFVEQLEGIPDEVVIVDMVGDSDLKIFYEANSDPELMAEIWGIAAELGHEAFIPATKHSLLDDHTPFLQQGIPAIDIIDFDYPSWHTTQDTLDKVSSESLEQVGRTLHHWLVSK